MQQSADWYNDTVNKQVCEKLFSKLIDAKDIPRLRELALNLKQVYDRTVQLLDSPAILEKNKQKKTNRINVMSLSLSQSQSLSSGNTKCIPLQVPTSYGAIATSNEYQIIASSAISIVYVIENTIRKIKNIHITTSKLLSLPSTIESADTSLFDVCAFKNNYIVVWQALSEFDKFKSIMNDIEKHNKKHLVPGLTLLDWYYNKLKWAPVIEDVTSFVAIYVSIRNVDSNHKDGFTIGSRNDGLVTINMKKHIGLELILRQPVTLSFGPFKNFTKMDSDIRKDTKRKLLITYGYSGTGKSYNIQKYKTGNSNTKNTNKAVYIYNNEVFDTYNEKFIRKTPNNPVSSRAFTFFKSKVENLDILDMAGHEDPQWFVTTMIPTLNYQALVSRNKNINNVIQDTDVIPNEQYVPTPDKFYRIFSYLFNQKKQDRLTYVLNMNKIQILMNRMYFEVDGSVVFKHLNILSCYILLEDMNKITYMNKNNETVYVTEQNIKTLNLKETSFISLQFSDLSINAEKKSLQLKRKLPVYQNSNGVVQDVAEKLTILLGLIKVYMQYVFARYVALSRYQKHEIVVNGTPYIDEVVNDFNTNFRQNYVAYSQNKYPPEQDKVYADLNKYASQMQNINSQLNSCFPQQLMSSAKDELFQNYMTDPASDETKALSYYLKIYEVMSKTSSSVSISNKPKDSLCQRFAKEILGYQDYSFDNIILLIQEAVHINNANKKLQVFMKDKKATDKMTEYIEKQTYDKIMILANIRDDVALSQRLGAYKSLQYVSLIKST